MPASPGPHKLFLELHKAGASDPPFNKGPLIMIIPAYTVLYHLPPAPLSEGGFAAFPFTYNVHPHRIAPQKILQGDAAHTIACHTIVDWVV